MDHSSGLVFRRQQAASHRRAVVYFCSAVLTLVTSNLPFNEGTEIFGSERLTGALLDRLTHHVHILELNGDSFRLAHSKHARKDAAAPAS